VEIFWLIRDGIRKVILFTDHLVRNAMQKVEELKEANALDAILYLKIVFN
jgi:hypothetical protein